MSPRIKDKYLSLTESLNRKMNRKTPKISLTLSSIQQGSEGKVEIQLTRKQSSILDTIDKLLEEHTPEPLTQFVSVQTQQSDKEIKRR